MEIENSVLLNSIFFASYTTIVFLVPNNERALGTLAVSLLCRSPLNAQVTSTTPGEIAVYSNFSAFAVNVVPGVPVDNTFTYDELNLANLAVPTTDTSSNGASTSSVVPG